MGIIVFALDRDIYNRIKMQQLVVVSVSVMTSWSPRVVQDFLGYDPKEAMRKRYATEIILEDPESNRFEGPRVTVSKTVTRTVSEYEAEVLCRNGWEIVL